MQRVTVVTGPIIEPVTVGKVRTRCRLVSNRNDEMLSVFIAEERARAERLTGLALLTQTLLATRDSFPLSEFDHTTDGDVILLPGPVQEITEVVYDDEDGVETILDADLYVLDTSPAFARLAPALDETWPDTAGTIGAVRITYVAGYASVPEIPADITGRILDAIMFRFDGERDQEFLDGLYVGLFCGVW